MGWCQLLTLDPYLELRKVTLDNIFQHHIMSSSLVFEPRDWEALWHYDLSLNIKLELSLTPTSYMLITGAMNHLARILACEWAQDNIRTNSVTPWFVATPLTESVRTILFTLILNVIYMNAVSFFLLIS